MAPKAPNTQRERASAILSAGKLGRTHYFNHWEIVCVPIIALLINQTERIRRKKRSALRPIPPERSTPQQKPQRFRLTRVEFKHFAESVERIAALA